MISLSKQERENALEKMLRIIKKNPGIRLSELNRRLNREHSANLRNTLIRQGLIRKEHKGPATYYYPIEKPQDL